MENASRDLLRKRRKKNFHKYLPIYCMMIPGFLYLLINNYFPLPGLQLAFKKFKYSLGIWGSSWNGVSNFRYLFRSPDSFMIIRNTLCYNLVFILLGTILSIVVAILLNEIRSKKLQQVYQTFILIPYLLSYVIVSYIVYAFLGADNGMINNTILRAMGFEGIAWYTQAKYWPFILVIVQLWKSFGYSTIIYFASIIGIDHSLYEAAVVDGASSWKQITHITLPLLKPVIIILTMLAIGRILYSDFGLFYQVPMNSGMLYSTTSTIDTFVYRGLLETNDVGRASAAGFLQSVLGFVLVLTTNGIVRSVEKEYALF